MINRGGEKISPREIDEVLLAHPAVAEAVCFGSSAPDLGRRSRGRRRSAAGERCRSGSDRAGAAGLLQREAGRVQAPEADSHRRRHSTHRHRQDSAARRGRGVRCAGVVKIVIAGAGAIGGYIGARLARAGADVVLFARGPHLRAMQTRGLARHERRRRLRGPAAGHRQPGIDRQGRRRVSRGQGAQPDARSHRSFVRCSATIPIVVSTQNGIPWWYFQSYGRRARRASARARRSRRASSPRRSRRDASSGRSRTSRPTSSSPASFITPRAIASASASRTARSPSASRRSPRR